MVLRGYKGGAGWSATGVPAKASTFASSSAGEAGESRQALESDGVDFNVQDSRIAYPQISPDIMPLQALRTVAKPQVNIT